MELAHDHFLATVARRAADLPRLRLAIVGEPARAAALVDRVFGLDQRYLSIAVMAALPDEPVHALWTFDPAVLAQVTGAVQVGDGALAPVIEATLAAIATPAARAQLVSYQDVDPAAQRRVARELVAAFVAGAAGLADPAALLVDALAMVAIAHGFRLDTARYERREQLKELAGSATAALRTLPALPARDAATVLARLGDAFAAACADLRAGRDPAAALARVDLAN